MVPVFFLYLERYYQPTSNSTYKIHNPDIFVKDRNNLAYIQDKDKTKTGQKRDKDRTKTGPRRDKDRTFYRGVIPASDDSESPSDSV